MKKSDIATVILIAGFSSIVAFVLANVFLGDPNDESVMVEYLPVISSDLSQPDPELFNSTAINPTVEVYIGQCKEGETWDSDAGSCVSNKPAGSDEDEDADSDEDSDGGLNLSPTSPSSPISPTPTEE